MHLLLVTTLDQQSYLPRFSRLSVLIGHKVSVLMECPTTLSELELKCKRVGIEGIVVCNADLLEKALNALPDFLPPATRKKLTLDDYQGSTFKIKGLPAVVLNPPEHIMTVTYGAFIADRFLKKLIAPAEWYKQTAFEWELADDPARLEHWYEKFQEARLIAVDIETPIPNTHKTFNCISFTAWFPKDHRTMSIVIPFTDAFMLAWIRKFADLPAPKVLQGGTYDVVYLMRFRIFLRAWYWDTLNLMHSYYSEFPKRLDFVAAYSLLNIRYWKDDGKSGNLQDYYRYNAMDGWATLNSLLSLLDELPDWAQRNYLEEFPLVYPAVTCELEGWKVDKERFEQVAKEKESFAAAQLVKIQTSVRNKFFNPRSPQQMKLLFKVLGCGDLKSTDKANTMVAQFRHPLNARVLGDILEYKAEAKLLSAYIDASKFWNWRLFYRLNPAGTDSGRLASSASSFWVGFQIQNIPRGDAVKQFLVADSSWLLAEPDCSQAEARCVFYLAGEEKGIALVESGKDYHSWNVQEFFGIPYTEIWNEELGEVRDKKGKEIRDLSKRTNHGANYNMTENVMLSTMGPKHVSKAKLLLKFPASFSLKQVCASLLQRYGNTYSKVKKDWYAHIMLTIETTRKLVSPLGWTRHFFGDVKGNRHHKNSAIAHGPQNLSVGIINRCFYAIWHRQIYGDFNGVLRLKAQIHDSIPFQYKQDQAWVVEEVKKMMTYPVEVKGADGKTRTIVIPIGMKAGKQRWSEL